LALLPDRRVGVILFVVVILLILGRI
jgi:hypothetical protein